MDINSYKNEALNVLRTIKPEWAEINEPHSAIDVIALCLSLIKPSIESSEVQALNNGYTGTADLQHLIRGQGSVNNVVYLGSMNTRQVILVICNNEGTLEKGFRAADTASRIYKTTEDIEVQQGANYIVFEAEESGPISSPTNTITKILTPNALVVSVTNPILPSFIGREAESEQSYRIRVELAKQGQALSSSILENQLISLAGCTRAKAYFNSTPIQIEYIRPYSYSVVVVGGDPDTIFNIIASHDYIQEQSYYEATKHTKTVTIHKISLGGKEQSSSIFCGYCEAVNVPYYVNIYTRNFPITQITNLKDFIIQYLANNYIENFQQSIQSAIFITATNQFISDNQLSQVAVISSELSYDGTNFTNEISPQSVKDILTLTQEYINIINVNN